MSCAGTNNLCWSSPHWHMPFKIFPDARGCLAYKNTHCKYGIKVWWRPFSCWVSRPGYSQPSWRGYCKFIPYQVISSSFAEYWQRAKVSLSMLSLFFIASNTMTLFLCAKKGTLHPLCSTRDTNLSPCSSPKSICILESIEKHNPAENNLCRVQFPKNYFMGVYGLKREAYECWKKRFQYMHKTILLKHLQKVN